MSLPKGVWAITVLLAMLLAVTGCSSRDNDQTSTQSAESANPAQTIENKGSDTMVNLALAWAETYMKERRSIRISVTGGGSGTGIAAMINGTVNLANASRAMKEDEFTQARDNGITPLEHIVAQDAIAVVVNPANPISRLTIPQLSDIFSGEITNWKDVGGEDRPIVLLSRESNSGTYVYFLENVIQYDESIKGRLFSPDTLLLPSSEGISSEVRQNPNVIGYDGLGYVTPDQKTVAVAIAAGEPYVSPSAETVNDGSYPIARPLYMYTAGEPEGEIKEYLDWIWGPEGQELVQGLGFVPYDLADNQGDNG